MTCLNTLALPDLYTRLTADGVTAQLFQLARAEDLGQSNLDITTAAMGIGGHPIETMIVTRESGIASGLAAINDLLPVFAPNTTCNNEFIDGSAINPGDTLATLCGPAGEVLALERTMLNLLGRLSGIATLTRRYVDAIDGAKAKILDTRKTTPGWRALEKYAVRCGGGHCHRVGLFDAALIKDNHIALAQTGAADLTEIIQETASRARSAHKPAFVEVEVDTLDQLEQILKIKPGLIDIALLDNMPAPALSEAVELRNKNAPDLLLEASGGVNLDTIAEIAKTGIDRISIGALTHQAISLDIGLDYYEK